MPKQPQPFVSGIRSLTNSTTTENGDTTYQSSLCDLVDLFGSIGSMRKWADAEVFKAWSKAYDADALKALKMLFFARDIRGGLGERATARKIFKWLADKDPNTFALNLSLIPEFGRWDDLVELIGTPVTKNVVDLIQNQLAADESSSSPSLMAKWLPSENTSSRETRRKARLLRKALNMDPKTYRQTLSILRKKIGLVETALSQRAGTGINYDHVPSKAAMLYRKAFGRKDPTGYAAYIAGVQQGTRKINSSALFPYEIVATMQRSQRSDRPTLEAQWKALPNYIGEGLKNAIAVVDVSGSMMGFKVSNKGGATALDVSLSLGIYLAERNVGPFKDAFITFSANPTMQRLIGNTLEQKIANMNQAEWGMNTNIRAVFDLVLQAGITGKVAKEDMPRAIIIVSDMQFDAASRITGALPFIEEMKNLYAQNDYQLPQLVFWNVAARVGQQPVRFDENGTCLISGASPTLFNTCLSGEITTPEDIMLKAICDKRYAAVRI